MTVLKAKRITVAIGLAIVLYFGASALAYRNYWVGLFWGTYLPWLPKYDIIEGSKQSIEKRDQYDAAVKFITGRMLTPSTAKFCSIDEEKFGLDESGMKAMDGWVDAQNAFGAMIRSNFRAVFRRNQPTKIDHVRWAGEDGQTWR
jgi:hypothetical protein